MKPICHLLQILLLCLAAWTPLAQAQVSPDTAEQPTRKSGLWAQLGTLGPQMRQGLDQSLTEAGAAVPDAARQRLLAEAGATFTAERLRASALRELAEAVLTCARHGLAGLVRQPSRHGRGARRGRGRRPRPRPQIVIRQGAALMDAAAPGRRALIAGVVEAAGAARALTDVVTEITVASRAAALRAAPASPLPLAQALRARRPAATDAGGLLRGGFCAVCGDYKDLPDEQLEAYVRQLGTSAGEHFNDAGRYCLPGRHVAGAGRAGQGALSAVRAAAQRRRSTSVHCSALRGPYAAVGDARVACGPNPSST